MLTKLSTRFIFHKKSRSLIIVAAACLAAFLFCTVLLISVGMIETIQNDAKKGFGDYTIGLAYGEKAQQEAFMDLCKGSELTKGNIDGYIDFGEKNFSVWTVSDNWYDTFACELLSGRYPNKENEIIIPIDDFTDAENYIGKTITADMYRMVSEDGEILNERYGLQPDEHKEVLGTVNFCIVGVYEDDVFLHRFGVSSAIYLYDDGKCEDFSHVFSKTLKRAVLNRAEDLISPDAVFYNHNYLTTFGFSGTGESVFGALVTVCSVLLVLVALTVLLLIGNAFSLSFREHVQELGMLSSIGAGTAQICGIFALEAIILSGVGAIAGFLLSIAVVYLSISTIAPYIQQICYVSIPFVMPSVWLPILISTGITLIVSIAAALWPLRVIKKRSAIELMRESYSFKKSKRLEKIKRNKTEFFLAERYRVSNLRRFVIMVGSTGLSIIVLLISIGVCNGQISSGEEALNSVPFDINVRYYSEDMAEISSFREQLYKEKTVDEKKSYWYILCLYDYHPEIKDEYYDNYAPNVIVVPMDEFSKIAGGLINADFIFAQNTTSFEVKGNDVTEINESLFNDETIVAVDSEFGPLNLGRVPWINVYKTLRRYEGYTNSLLIIPENKMPDGIPLYEGEFYIFAAAHRTICENYEVKEGVSVHDLAMEYEDQKTNALTVKIFLYVFMSVIILVCFANMFFTVFTNHKLRAKDYLVLQTLGMIPKQTRLMILYECFISCVAVLLIGGIGTTVLAFLSKLVNGLYFKLPAGAAIAVVVLTVLVHFLSFVMAERQTNRLNMIEGIKRA